MGNGPDQKLPPPPPRPGRSENDTAAVFVGNIAPTVSAGSAVWGPSKQFHSGCLQYWTRLGTSLVAVGATSSPTEEHNLCTNLPVLVAAGRGA